MSKIESTSANAVIVDYYTGTHYYLVDTPSGLKYVSEREYEGVYQKVKLDKSDQNK